MLANVFTAIVENMIKNFKKRKTIKPKIDIKVTKDSKYYYIEISDNGGGIQISPIESIFEKDLTNANSTGLGLFLVRSILTFKLKGKITATNKNSGVSFLITLEY